jgi:hypothetical protein
MCYRTPDCGQRRGSRLTSGNLAPQDVDNRRCPIGENFLYVFKGARSAPCELARRTCKSAARGVHGPRRGAWTVRNWLATLRTLARSRSPGLPLLGPAGPRRRPARVRPEVTAETDTAPQAQRWRAALQEGPSLRCPDPEALQVRGQARLWPLDNRERSNCLAQVHAKTGLTAPLTRSQGAPVGGMARTERRRGSSSVM